jgi:hypothetical protein
LEPNHQVFDQYRKDPDMKLGTAGATVGDMYEGIKVSLDRSPSLPVVFIPLSFSLSGGSKVSALQEQ